MPLDNKPKRVSEVNTIIEAFKLNHSQILQKFESEFIGSPGEAICDAYEILLDRVIKEFLREGAKAQIYKVASGLELATLYIQPIKCRDVNATSMLNVTLAYSIAGTFVLQKKFGDSIPAFTSKLERECYAVNQNHLDFLRYLSIDNFHNPPVFSNSIYWQAFELIMEFDEHLSKI